MNTIKISFPANFQVVPGIRSLISRIASAFGFEEKEAYQIETIVDELCNNAIEHGSAGNQAAIELECEFDKQKIAVTVKDSGGKELFNPEQILKQQFQLLEKEKDNLALFERRGRGLVIVKKLSDELDITVGEKGTHVKVVKKRQGSAA